MPRSHTRPLPYLDLQQGRQPGEADQHPPRQNGPLSAVRVGYPCLPLGPASNASRSPGPLGQSLAGRALHGGMWSLDVTNIRDFTLDRHRTVDDTPFGGVPAWCCGRISSMRPQSVQMTDRWCA